MTFIQRNIFKLILATGLIVSGCADANKSTKDVLSSGSIEISKSVLLNKINKAFITNQKNVTFI